LVVWGFKKMMKSEKERDKADGCGAMVAELADLMQRGKRRTFADAVKLAARRRHVSELVFLCAAFAEIGGDVAETVRRRVERATMSELSARRTVSTVECPGGIDRRASFTFSFELDFAARLALGLIFREKRGGEWLRGGFAAAVERVLIDRAAQGAKARGIGGVFSLGLDLVEWTRDDMGRPDMDGGRIVKAPDALAMPDKGAPLGFATLADLRTRRTVSHKADNATRQGGVK